MRFPEASTIRSLILKAKPTEARFLFMVEYLACSRICELVSQKYLSDVTTSPKSLTGKSVRQTVYRSGKEKHDVVIIEVKTAKRKGTTRYIALPLDKKYEPFTEELFDYLKQFGSDPCFPFTRQHAYLYARDAFKNLESEKTKLLAEVTKLRKEAEEKAAALECEVAVLREEAESLKKMLDSF
jgi:hypothetical protein